jgi:hypothetical protein
MVNNGFAFLAVETEVLGESLSWPHHDFIEAVLAPPHQDISVFGELEV